MHGATMDSNISFIISVQWEPSCSMRAVGRTYGRNVILVGNWKVNSRFPQFCEREVPEKTIGVLYQEIRILRNWNVLCPWCITKKESYQKQTYLYYKQLH
jgi:hypothetical protein